MANGGHFHHPHSELLAWDKLARPLSDLLRDRGFVFCAHTMKEVGLARDMGWPMRSIFFDTKAESYVPFYKTAKVYVGNRVHGGAVCAAQGVPSFVITYDSRLRMAERIGATVGKPSWTPIDYIKTWLADPPRPLAAVNFQTEFDWHVEQLKKMG